MILYAGHVRVGELLGIEPGSAEIFAAIGQAERLAWAAIAYAELRAALAAAVRAGRLKPRWHQRCSCSRWGLVSARFQLTAI